MLVTLNVVQDECRPITRREHQHRLFDREPINQLLAGIGAACHSQPGLRSLPVIRLHFRSRAAIAEVHLDLIAHEAVEPRREQCVAPETADTTEDRDERFLRQVFGVRNVACHTKRDAVNKASVTTVDLIEGRRVSIRRQKRTRFGGRM